jgi:hypothetical protein
MGFSGTISFWAADFSPRKLMFGTKTESKAKMPA